LCQTAEPDAPDSFLTQADREIRAAAQLEHDNIVAIHQHMTHEEPRIMFFHYWGRGPAKDLANAVKGGFLVGGLLKVSSPL
jgi:hypothetical protein